MNHKEHKEITSKIFYYEQMMQKVDELEEILSLAKWPSDTPYFICKARLDEKEVTAAVEPVLAMRRGKALTMLAEIRQTIPDYEG